LPNLLRSDRPDGEAQSFLFAFNLWAWRPLRSYSLHQIRERWKYFAHDRRDRHGGLDLPQPRQ